MPDRITLDDALTTATPKTGTDRITFDEAMAIRESQASPQPALPNGGGQILRDAAGIHGGDVILKDGRYVIAPKILPPEESHIGANIKSRLVEDADTQRKILAKSLFPNDPKGVDRVGFADGAPVYVDDKGQLRRVSWKFANFLSSFIANTPEAVGATIGSLSASPVIGGAAGAVGARGLKRAAAGLIFDEPQTISGNLTDLATEGALNLGAGLVGKGAVKFSDRGKIVNFAPADLKTAEQTRAYIKQTTGIDLDLAQASGDRKLIALRNYAARYPGQSAEAIQAADEAAHGQFEQATNRVLNLVAGAKPSELAGREGVNAAQATIYAARQRVYGEVRPLYEEAYAAKPEISNPRLLSMLELPHFKESFAAGQRIAKLEGVALKPGENPDLRSLDLTKQGLDDRIDTLKQAGRRSEARALKVRRDEFVSFLDNVTDDKYQLARQRYATLMEQQVAPLENGPVGILAQIKDQKLATAAAKVFSDPNVPVEQVAMTKAVLSQQNPDAYRGLVRQWMGQQYNRAMKETQTANVVNPAGKFRQAVYGTPEMKKRTQAMLPADASQAFDDLMGAAEKLASTPIRGSDTAFNQQITEQLKGRALAALSWIISPRQAAKTAAEQRAIESGVESLTEALLDPAKRLQLRQITRMAPSTKQTILLGTLLGGQTVQNAAAGIGDDRMPLLSGQAGQ